MMLEAESKYQAEIEQLVKKHRDRLSNLIVTRTRLPLRDLSMAVAMLLTHHK
jgi:hypothetical protein